jgi:glycerophosphoryl diester phosphodiesterase
MLDGLDDEPHKVSILCFDLKPLERIKRMAPALQTIYLFSRWRPELHAARRRPDYVDAIGPASRFLARNPRLLQWAQDLELPVHTWTVNDPIEVKSWCNAGVDGIITDDPGLVRRFVAPGSGSNAGLSCDGGHPRL